MAPVFTYECEQATITRSAGTGLRATLVDGSVRHYPDPEDDPWRKVAETVAAVRTRQAPVCSIGTAMAHMRTVASIQTGLGSGWPITEPDLHVVGDGAEQWWNLPEMENTLALGFAAGQLPYELGASWAKPAHTVPVLDLPAV